MLLVGPEEVEGPGKGSEEAETGATDDVGVGGERTTTLAGAENWDVPTEVEGPMMLLVGPEEVEGPGKGSEEAETGAISLMSSVGSSRLLKNCRTSSMSSGKDRLGKEGEDKSIIGTISNSSSKE